MMRMQTTPVRLDTGSAASYSIWTAPPIISSHW